MNDEHSPRHLWCDADAVVIKDRILRLAHSFREHGEVDELKSIPHIPEIKYTTMKYYYSFEGVGVVNMVINVAMVRPNEHGGWEPDIAAVWFGFKESGDMYRFIFPREWLIDFTDQPTVRIYSEDELYERLDNFIEDYL